MKKLIIPLIIILLIMIVTSTSVAFFIYAKDGNTENTVVLMDGMKFIYKEVDPKGSGIHLENVLPVSDAEGKVLNEYFDFKIEAKMRDESVTYNVILNTTRTTIPDNYLKIYLTEVNGSTETEITSTMKKLSEYAPSEKGRIIYTETIDHNSVTNYEKNFRLRIWLTDDINDYDKISGRTAIYTVDVNAEGGTNPTAPVIAGGRDEWATESSTIRLSSFSTAFSGIDYYEVYDTTDNTQPTEETIATATTQEEYPIITEGKHYVYYRAVARDGLKSEWSNQQIVEYDVTGPTVPTTGAIGNVAGSNTTGTIQTPANGSNDEGVGGITYKYLVTNTDTVPDKNSQDFTTDLTFERSCGTSYYGWVVAEDALGNRSEVKSLGSTSDGANVYSGWSACSKTCGTGTQTQTNSCALVTTDLIRNCNTQACAITLTTKVEIDNSQTGPSQWYLWVKLNSVPSAYQGNIKLRLPNGTQLTGNYQQGNLFFNTTTNSMINTSQCTIISTNPSGQWNLANYNGRSIVVGG